jgi:CRISPR-associated protein Csx3
VGRGHLVSAAKQRAVLRPHGHLMRSGGSWEPDEDAVTVTSWMAGSFVSHLTQGHVSRTPVLSMRRSYLGLKQAHGLRIFVGDAEGDEAWSLLGPPSAWFVSSNSCRWWYATDAGTIEVCSTTPETEHAARVEVHSDRPLRLLVAAHLALFGDDGADVAQIRFRADDSAAVVAAPEGEVEFGWSTVGPVAVAGDEALFDDGQPGQGPWLTLHIGATTSFSLSIRPTLTPADTTDRPLLSTRPGLWDGIAGGLRFAPPETAAGAEAARIAAVLPWFAHDAFIHYLSPRGLEQYTGGGWGTRDVCQGPVGLLLAYGRHAELRALVLRIFRAQNARGDWPQAFEFYRRFIRWGQGDSHGDVVYWPLLALGDYLVATGDTGLLGERLDYVGDGGPVDEATVLDHVRRALGVIEAGRIPGTVLPAYGNGDWNDSLQPADHDLAAHLCSTWTVVLQAQSLGRLARGLTAVTAGPTMSPADEVAARAARIADEGTAAMHEFLVIDGVLAGYGLFDAQGRVVEHLVHPSDERTGLRYSILPMIHAIADDLLPPESAARHLAVIREHLTGPDGGRLFDRPVRYSGGPMRVFQRAEASTFFGREIGIMYTHAHLRYAETLARVGDADGLLLALAQANPIGVTERIPSARPRQSTAYYSSSDAVFADRYAAAEGYDGVLEATVPLEGGWRVYSSGPGLYLRLVVENLCGIRSRGERVEIDPVLAVGLDGLQVTVPVRGVSLRVRYTVGARGHGPYEVRSGEAILDTEPLTNRYRAAGVSVSFSDLVAAAGQEIRVLVP